MCLHMGQSGLHIVFVEWIMNAIASPWSVSGAYLHCIYPETKAWIHLLGLDLLEMVQWGWPACVCLWLYRADGHATWSHITHWLPRWQCHTRTHAYRQKCRSIWRGFKSTEIRSFIAHIRRIIKSLYQSTLLYILLRVGSSPGTIGTGGNNGCQIKLFDANCG